MRRAAEVLRTVAPDREIGIRLDSGDLAALAVRARSILDAAGLTRARIVVSGGLDEYGIEELHARGAPVDVLAVGTKVGTAADAPYLDAAYKLVEYEGRPVMKLSAGKATSPGAKQVFRGPGCADVLGLRDQVPPPGSEPLLEPVVRAGRRTGPRLSAAEAVAVARRRFLADLDALPVGARALQDPMRLRPRVSAQLQELTRVTRDRLTSGTARVPARGA